jgi:hypothetical protein
MHAGRNGLRQRQGHRPTHCRSVTMHWSLLALRVECCTFVDGINSPIQDFAGPVVLAGLLWCDGCDGGAVLIDSRGNGAPAQEGLPRVFLAGVLSVCAWGRLLLMWLLLLLFTSLNSKSDLWAADVVP